MKTKRQTPTTQTCKHCGNALVTKIDHGETYIAHANPHAWIACQSTRRA